MATTAQKPKKKERARFEAPGTGLRIILTKQKEVFGEGGVKQFIPGTGRYVLFQPDGFGGQFYETEDAEVISILREKEKISGGTFFEVPIPKPSSGPVLQQITQLAVRGDAEALIALAAEEEETHQRQDVLDTIADALEQIRG
jgi:hypothetical protein